MIIFAIAARGTLSVAAEPAGAPHGAMPMQQQQQRLDQLIKRSIDPPSGIDPVAWATIYMLQGNELTPDRIALGRKLYFDTRLSKDGTLACATCHDVSRGFSDHRSVSEGIGDHLHCGAESSYFHIANHVPIERRPCRPCADGSNT
jgi:cytochrome c peroxidase